MTTRLDYIGGMRNVQPTPQGGLRSPAYLTRSGIFEYTQADGSVVRELRHPDEVFSDASLSTLRGAPLTIGHPGLVTSENWSQLSVGFIADSITVDGMFISADVVIQESDAVKKVAGRDLVELSCGYDCDVIFDSGTWEGAPYDAVQKNIRYNHVGLGPKNWGRAGTEVALRLDGGEGLSYTLLNMTCEKCTHDPCDCPVEEVSEVPAPEATPVVEPVVEEVPEVTLDGKNQLELRIQELEALVASHDATLAARVDERIRLIDSAREALGTYVWAGKNDAQIMLDVILGVDSSFKGDGRSEDYLRGRFDSVVTLKTTENQKLASLRVDSLTQAPDRNPVEEARLNMLARNLNAWKTPAGK